MSHTKPVNYEYYAKVRKDGQYRTLEVRPRAFANWGTREWLTYAIVSTLFWGCVLAMCVAAYRFVRHLVT